MIRAGDQHDASGIVMLAVAKKAAMAEALTIMRINNNGKDTCSGTMSRRMLQMLQMLE
jgi:hypothetical protein